MTVYTIEAKGKLFCVCRDGQLIAQCDDLAAAWRKTEALARQEAEEKGETAIYRTDPGGAPRAAWVVRGGV
jgi:hypothetical protein